MVLIGSHRSFLLALLSLCASVSSAAAQELVFPSKGKGEDIVIKLDPSMAGKTLSIYAAAPKSNYQTVDIAVKGVGGEVITAEAFTLTGGQSAETAMKDPKNALALFGYGAVKSTPKIKIKKPEAAATAYAAADSVVSGTPDPSCGCMTAGQIDDALAIYRRYMPNATRADFCNLLPKPTNGICQGTIPGYPDTPGNTPGNTPGGEPAAGSASATAYVPYNACLKAARPGVLVKINLSEVDAAALDGGEITATVKLRAFGGNTRAALKESDGGKFPGWISLTAPVGGYNGGDLIEMVNWKGKRISKTRRLKVGDIVYYAGPLSRTPLGGNLSGGSGTFHVSSRGEGYSFCAKFVKVRQQFNGYKKLA